MDERLNERLNRRLNEVVRSNSELYASMNDDEQYYFRVGAASALAIMRYGEEVLEDPEDPRYIAIANELENAFEEVLYG